MRSLLLFLSVFIPLTAFSQITIESNTLPKVGDVLIYQDFAGYEDTLAYQQNGEDVTWDIGRLNITGTSEEAYEDISMSELADSFPDANMLVDLNGFQAAALRGPNSIEILGISTGNQGGFGGFNLDSIDAAINFDDNYVLRQTPLTYGSRFEDGFEVIFTFPASLIPGLDSIDTGALGGALESIRITTTASKSEEVVGWGSLSIWETEKEVLKVEQIDVTETIIEVGVNVFGFVLWINAGDLLGGGMDVGFGGAQEVTTYKFLSADLQTSFVEFTENRFADTLGNNFITVSGRVSGNVMSSNENLSFDEGSLALYPNPSYDFITLETADKNLGSEWSIEIIDLQGQRILSLPSYQHSDKIDVSGLQAGHYLLRVSTESNNYLTKMTVVK